jgi:arabinan endo-1,5-alpha-L-arabinosidase
MLMIVLALVGGALAADGPGIALEEIHIRDPFIVADGERGLYYMYCNQNPFGKRGIYAYTSRDLKRWEGPSAVFYAPEDYWGQRDFWAPEVHAYQGRYYMFVTFSPAEKGPRGTAILVSEGPEGPFKPHSEGPVTPPDWYALDGTLYVDESGKPWMVFCHEWIQIGDGAMCAVRLSEDLSRAEGEPETLFHASDAPWGVESHFEGKPGRVTDGPWIHRLEDGSLLMLWSTFGAGRDYMTGVARSRSGKITGPWTVDPEPIYRDDGGHPMLFRSFDGKLILVVHQPNKQQRERARLFELILENGDIALKAF